MTPGGFQSQISAIMSGRKTGVRASVLRAMLASVEPLYASVVRFRNWMFDGGLRKVRHAPRPVISIGNLTTGGTGKTPVVAWLVRSLLDRGHRPAVLLRGYKSVAGVSDEAALLQQMLAPVKVIAQSDRVAAASEVAEHDPTIDCFVLDDGFQHRRLARSLDVVLIDATEPFGFDHVLPRGMLREPVSGLGRCDCVIVTRCENASEATLNSILERIRTVCADRPIVRCFMQLDYFLDEYDQKHPIDRADGIYAICGIGNPRNFFDQLRRQCGPLIGERAYPDHFAFRAEDLAAVFREASSLDAKTIVTTEKDWTKLKTLRVKAESKIAIWRAVLRVDFASGDAERLLKLAEAALTRGRVC